MPGDHDENALHDGGIGHGHYGRRMAWVVAFAHRDVERHRVRPPEGRRLAAALTQEVNSRDIPANLGQPPANAGQAAAAWAGAAYRMAARSFFMTRAALLERLDPEIET